MELAVDAKTRADTGRGAARRMRRAGKVPGVMYGKGAPQSILLNADELSRQLQREEFHSSVVSLNLDGKKRSTLLREVQLHPLTRTVVHVDFQEIDHDRPITAQVPVHFTNHDTCPGVKLRHGIFSVTLSELQVHCLPTDLPGSISVDVGDMELGGTLHLSSIEAPEGVIFWALQRGEDPAVATILAPQLAEEETAEAKPDSDEFEDVAAPSEPAGSKEIEHESSS